FGAARAECNGLVQRRRRRTGDHQRERQHDCGPGDQGAEPRRTRARLHRVIGSQLCPAALRAGFLGSPFGGRRSGRHGGRSPQPHHRRRPRPLRRIPHVRSVRLEAERYDSPAKAGRYGDQAKAGRYVDKAKAGRYVDRGRKNNLTPPVLRLHFTRFQELAKRHQEGKKLSKLATCFFLAAGLVLGTGTDALSQQFTGGIRGTVRDANGVIPGAAVVATNEATSVPRDTVTNAVGEYNFPALAPATYTVRASLPGYKVYERRGIRIATQQFVTLDLPLEVGAIEESITVTADSPLIETSNASQGGVLDRQSLEELPAAGRNAFMIGVTIPTVLSVGEPRFNRQQDQMVSSQLSLGGGGVQANNYTLDGVPITDMRGFPVLNPTIEAIDDVKVQVHTFDAEMGRTGGGVFNTTARSGAN